MILITTSRRPTRSMRTLCKELNRVLPDTIRINRGKMSISGVAEEALEYKADRVIIVERYKGGPGRVLLYKIISDKLKQFPPQIHITGVKTQDELGQRTSVKESLIITTPKSASAEIRRLASALSNFLKLPYIEEVLKQLDFQASIHVSPITNHEAKISFTKPPIIKEVGPIMFVKHISWENIEGELEEH